MKRKRLITCMTGTRADYPRVKSVLEEISNRPDLELKLIVTGLHLVKEFGYTVREIEKDGFEIAERIPMYTGDDSPYGMAKAAARCADGIADAMKEIEPEIFLLTVDRVETLATAQSVALMNIPIAHVQGGEVTGTIDESIRHAVTKLSHMHFTATTNDAKRIMKMGENPRYIYAVGCPYIDIIKRTKYRSKEALSLDYGFGAKKPLVLFTQHPVTTEYGQGAMQMMETIKALQNFPELEIVAPYPNADAGGREIIDTMKRHSQFHVFPNIKDTDFLGLMKNAAFMIGNSSAGIREAPSFRLPVINIGNRQNGRLRAANVIDVHHDAKAISSAIDKVLSDKEFKNQLKSVTNYYGDGKSAKRIVDVLEKVEITPQLIQKRIIY